MDWLYYLLEANLYLLLFYGFYRLFLQNETFYNSNRYFLLLTSIIAFISPIMQLGLLKPAPVIDNVLYPPPIIYSNEQFAKITFAPVQETFSITDWLYPTYLIIAICFAIKLGISLFKIIQLWLKAKKAKTGKITLIELQEQTTAFSFFNLLFIHPHLAEKETVLNHEMVHIKQKHSLDILFFELLQIICWFNPMIYFIKNDIKLLHEYIADELSTNSGIQKHEYAMFLIENSFGVAPTPLTNQIFNQSILKRRINMLNKKRTAVWARLRLLLTVPLVGAMLCTSTMAFTKDYGYVDLLPEKSKITATVKQEVPQVKKTKQIAPKAKAVKKDQVKFRFSPMYRKDKETEKPVLAETRLIVINGKPIENLTKFYGVSNAENILYRTKKGSLAKYGEKGKNGAVEITGSNIKYFTEVTLPSTPAVEPPPPRQDKVRFPPPIVKNSKQVFLPTAELDKKSGQVVITEKRYILVNYIPVEDNNKFYGIRNIDGLMFLKPSEAVKKYGQKAEHGAVIIQGKELEYFKHVAVAPKEDQVKFPPPIVKPDNQTTFHPRNGYKYDGKAYIPVQIDKRYIVINGEAVKDNSKFYGVSNAEKITSLSVNQAMKIYGDHGKNGAVEITGTNIKYSQAISGPPPPFPTITLNRSDAFFLKIPNSENDSKTLTVYNSKNEIVYNDSDYQDNWNGKLGNYKAYKNVKIIPGRYTYLMKIQNDPKGNNRGTINII
ncbi:MAG: hypothetical protein EOO44_18365 [Flavobacterium sp.]|nr:MAG: hypothetical protein EOO44_18365 [Flavobacterium sp.]